MKYFSCPGFCRENNIDYRGDLATIALMKNYTAIVEYCPATDLYVGYVPGFPGAHSQGATRDELQHNLQEVIEMLLEDGDPQLEADFVGTQNLVVA